MDEVVGIMELDNDARGWIMAAVSGVGMFGFPSRFCPTSFEQVADVTQHALLEVRDVFPLV